VGLTVQCPSCRGNFKPGVDTQGIPDAAPLLDDSGASAANDFDVDERFTPEVPDEATAEARKKRWKSAMPEVASAYQPSGALPMSAVMLMAAGVGVGIGTGVLAETIVGAIAAVVIALLVFLNGAFAVCGFIYCFGVVLLVIGGLISLAAPFLAGGWTSAATVTMFGQFGKNRNSLVAVLFSVLSTALSLLVFAFLFETFFKGWLESCPPFSAMAGSLDTPYLITIIVGGLLGVLVAGFVAREMVAQAKFCEECEQFMDESEVKSLGLGGLKAMTLAVSSGNAAAAIQLMEVADGNAAKVALFSCPQCSKGYVEVTAHFKCTWKDKEDSNKEKELTESWLTASMAIAEDHVKEFRSRAKADTA
jgi:hypothetical protein